MLLQPLPGGDSRETTSPFALDDATSVTLPTEQNALASAVATAR